VLVQVDVIVNARSNMLVAWCRSHVWQQQ